jgi:hypothetical protein
LKGIIPGNHSFQGGERLILFQIGLSSRVEETHVSLQVKLSKLEMTIYTTLIPCESWGSFQKEYFLQIIFSR